MDKIKTIKVREQDGSLSTESYYLSTDAQNIDTRNGKNVQEVLDFLDEDKISKTTDIVNNLASLETDKALSAKQGYELKKEINNLSDNILNGKKIGALGDSLINGNAIGYTYTAFYLIAQKNNMQYINYGLNGNPIARPSNYSGNTPMSERYIDMDNDLDYIIVLGGANDKRLNVPIETNSDITNETFKGALNVLIKGLLTKYPKKKILFMTNYNRYPDLNSLGLTDIHYVDAMLEICALYGIPCFDNYRKSGVSWYTNLQSNWLDEGIYRGIAQNKHFSPDGYKFLATIYEGLLRLL